MGAGRTADAGEAAGRSSSTSGSWTSPAAAGGAGACPFPVANAHIEGVAARDCLYHLGLHDDSDVVGAFGDTKWVLMGGSAERALATAERCRRTLGLPMPPGTGLVPMGKTERYTMYKVGPVISISHGIGVPSASVMLHELVKLLHYAGASDVTFMRLGTCGGLGVAPGTVVISTSCVNGAMEETEESWVLGKRVRRSTAFDAELAAVAAAASEGHTVDAAKRAREAEARARRVAEAAELKHWNPTRLHTFSDDDGRDIAVAVGKTLTADGFYEHQGRLDGALCEYTAAERDAWLRELHGMGVRNIEMESSLLASLCGRLGIRCAALNTVIVDRFKGDQVELSGADVANFSSNAQRLAARMILAAGPYEGFPRAGGGGGGGDGGAGGGGGGAAT